MGYIFSFQMKLNCSQTENTFEMIKLAIAQNLLMKFHLVASTICSLIGEVTITSINSDYIREVMVTSKNATICSLILVTLILVTSKK